jgi:hypothetical protein
MTQQSLTQRIYTQHLSLSYGKHDFETNRDSNAILDLVMEVLKETPTAYSSEQKVAELKGLPGLSSKNRVIGSGYLRDLQSALIKNGVSKGLEVVVDFDLKQDCSTLNLSLSTNNDPTHIYEFRIFQAHDESDYGQIYQQSTCAYQSSMGKVYLIVKEKPVKSTVDKKA